MCLKRFRTVVFERSELLFFLRLNGRVGAIPIDRESTDSLIPSCLSFIAGLKEIIL